MFKKMFFAFSLIAALNSFGAQPDRSAIKESATQEVRAANTREYPTYQAPEQSYMNKSKVLYFLAGCLVGGLSVGALTACVLAAGICGACSR